MPNHVTTVISASPEVIAEIKNRFASKNGRDEEFLDFAKVIPVPSDVYQGGLPISFETVKAAETDAQRNAVKTIGKLHQKVADLAADHDEIQKALDAILRLAATHNFDLAALGYPVRTWHDWNVEAWGTKWNSYSCDFQNNKIWIDTAWSSPEPILAEISRQLGADVTIKVQFADEDIGYNCGAYDLKGGEVISRQEIVPGSHQATRFACDIKGRDPEDYLDNEDDLDEGPGFN